MVALKLSHLNFTAGYHKIVSTSGPDKFIYSLLDYEGVLNQSMIIANCVILPPEYEQILWYFILYVLKYNR